jgi:hypothetical protein
MDHLEEDVVLKKRLDATFILYITTLDFDTYKQAMDVDSLGGHRGYFIIRAAKHGGGVEVLAKAASFEAAVQIFDLIDAAD